jgi:hypothetical protein
MSAPRPGFPASCTVLANSEPLAGKAKAGASMRLSCSVRTSTFERGSTGARVLLVCCGSIFIFRAFFCVFIVLCAPASSTSEKHRVPLLRLAAGDRRTSTLSSGRVRERQRVREEQEGAYGGEQEVLREQSRALHSPLFCQRAKGAEEAALQLRVRRRGSTAARHPTTRTGKGVGKETDKRVSTRRCTSSSGKGHGNATTCSPFSKSNVIGARPRAGLSLAPVSAHTMPKHQATFQVDQRD